MLASQERIWESALPATMLVRLSSELQKKDGEWYNGYIVRKRGARSADWCKKREGADGEGSDAIYLFTVPVVEMMSRVASKYRSNTSPERKKTRGISLNAEWWGAKNGHENLVRACPGESREPGERPNARALHDDLGIPTLWDENGFVPLGKKTPRFKIN